MAGVIGEFIRQFGLDERAATVLERFSPAIQLKILSTWNGDPGQDCSRKFMGFVKGFYDMDVPRGGRGRKRSRADAGDYDDSEALEVFREKFPMDDRCFEYLAGSPDEVRSQVMKDFRPRSADDDDYSGLLTSFTKKVRAGLEGEAPRGQQQQQQHTRVFHEQVQHARQGPRITRRRLDEFRQQFPMDDRAFEYLMSTSSATQAMVLDEFKPRIHDDDYSAPITAFTRSVVSRNGESGGQGAGGRHHQSSLQGQLNQFLRKYPMDERATEYLMACPPAVQQEVMESFAPRNISDRDFSRPITSFIRSVRRAGGLEQPRDRAGSLEQPTVPKGGGVWGDEGWLQAFRRIFPMDDRAYDFLESCPQDIQDAVVAEFRPRRPGEADYSGAVTSFVRLVKQRGSSGVKHAEGTPSNLLEGFKERYPMDDRAWEYLLNSPSPIQRKVLERFRAKQEGEADYSRLITSFIRQTNA